MSKVYFVRCNLEDGERVVLERFNLLLRESKLFKNIEKGFLVPIKTHLGEKGNKGHVAPKYIAAVGKLIKKLGGKPFICETSTLYVGKRANSVDHLNLAYDHGFTPGKVGMPIIMADGLSGHSQVPVKIDGVHHKEVYIAADVPLYDYLISVAHVTGHICTGMGATLKNLGMGLASRAGKLVQHSDIKPKIGEECVNCGTCYEWCPVGVIVEKDGKAFIQTEDCIGCGECISVCKFGAVKFSWNQESKILQEKMAEHTLAVLKGKRGKSLFINFAVKITKDCDCMAKDDPRICDDIGILISDDPISVEKATLDLVIKESGHDLFKESYPHLDPLLQMKHGEKIGLGEMDYELLEIK